MISIKNKAKIFVIIKLIYILSLVIYIFLHIVPFARGDSTYRIMLASSAGLVSISLGVLLIMSLLLLFLTKLKAALVFSAFGTVGTLMASMVIILNDIDDMKMNWGFSVVEVELGFYLLIFYTILIILANILLIANLSSVKCSRCKKIFKKAYVVKCDKCGKATCQACLDHESGICKKCSKEYNMKLKLVEQSKPMQQQSQQVIIQQPVSHQAETKHCINCGNIIKSIAKFCDECGANQ